MLQPSLTVDEFEPDDPLAEISRKLANVAITNNLRLGEDGTVDRGLLPVIKDCLQTREPTHPDTYEAVRLLRKYLTQAGSTNVNIQDILDLGVLNELKHLLTLYDLDETQFECTWIITNIGAGESRHTHTLVEAGFIPLLIECLKSPDCAPCVKAQAAWALSNIAGDSPELREILMQHGALIAVSQVLNQVFDAAIGTEPQWRSNRQLIQLYEDNEVKTDVKALVWTISNMTRGGFRTADYWESYIPAFEVLVKCTLFDHKELWADTAWGLSRIMYNIHKVDAFFSKVNVPSDFGERLVILLNSSKESVQGPALRFLVNLTSGPDEHSYALVDRHLIRALADVMDPDVNAPLRRDACLTVANLAAIPGHLSEGVLNDGGILRGLVENLRVPFYQYVKPEGRWRQCDWRASDQEEVEEEWKIVHECLWAVANLLEAAPNEGVRMLCHQEYHRIPLHLGRLAVYDAKLIPVNVCSKLMDAMNDLMDRNSALIGYKRCEYMEDWESLQVVDAIEQMAFVHSEAKELQERCQRLLSRLILTGDKHNKSNSNTLDIDNVAAMFGFTATNDATRKPQKRRILHGLEDGDVRLIENAVGKLSI